MNLKSSQKTFLIMAGIAVITLAVYWQVSGFDFINYDDNLYIYENPHIREGLTADFLIWAFTAIHGHNWLPLTWVSHTLDWQIFGLWAGGHHFTSVFIHILNSLLLFWIFRKMTGSVWRSALVAALFAIHPLHVQSVVWVAERKDVLSAFFFMLSLWAYGIYVQRQKWSAYIGVTIFFIFGLMSKPMVVTLPFVLLLLDYWPLKRISPDSRAKTLRSQVSRLIIEKLPLFFLSALSSVITLLVQKHVGAVTSIERIPLIDRLANVLISYITYIAKTLWPVKLAVFYPFPDHFPSWKIAVAVLILLAISLTAVVLIKRKPYILIGWLWFLGTLVPVIGIVQVGTQSMADRYTYLPMIGLFVMVAWSFPPFSEQPSWLKKGMATATGMVLLILSAAAWVQAGYWQNSKTLFSRALEVTSGNTIAHNNLGAALLNAGRADEAILHCREALKTNPGFTDAIFNLGAALMAKGQADDAVQILGQLLEMEPDHVRARNNLANALIQQGKIDEAVRHFQMILENQPNHVEANINMGAALLRMGRIDDALGHYRTAIQSAPGNPEAFNNMGVLFVQKNMLDEAKNHFQKALSLRPGYESAINNLRRLEQMQK
jgi:Flp pilus assembly protein TadD